MANPCPELATLIAMLEAAMCRRVRRFSSSCRLGLYVCMGVFGGKGKNGLWQGTCLLPIIMSYV